VSKRASSSADSRWTFRSNYIAVSVERIAFISLVSKSLLLTRTTPTSYSTISKGFEKKRTPLLRGELSTLFEEFREIAAKGAARTDLTDGIKDLRRNTVLPGNNRHCTSARIAVSDVAVKTTTRKTVLIRKSDPRTNDEQIRLIPINYEATPASLAAVQTVAAPREELVSRVREKAKLVRLGSIYRAIFTTFRTHSQPKVDLLRSNPVDIDTKPCIRRTKTFSLAWSRRGSKLLAKLYSSPGLWRR
jgi:hypothetical protein